MNNGEGRWSRMDKLECASTYLSIDDECYFYLERSNGTYLESFANNMVNNFQKSIKDFGGRPEVMRHKERAIRYFGKALSKLLSSGTPQSPWILVPMTTSLPKSHEHYDDRLLRASIYAAECSEGGILVDDVFDVSEPLKKAKDGGPRDPHYLITKIKTSNPKHPNAMNIVLVDDVLTLGGHFAACKSLACKIYPGAKIIGAFLSKHISKYEYGIDDNF